MYLYSLLFVADNCRMYWVIFTCKFTIPRTNVTVNVTTLCKVDKITSLSNSKLIKVIFCCPEKFTVNSNESKVNMVLYLKSVAQI